MTFQYRRPHRQINWQRAVAERQHRNRREIWKLHGKRNQFGGMIGESKLEQCGTRCLDCDAYAYWDQPRSKRR